MNAESKLSLNMASASTMSCHDLCYVVKVGKRCGKKIDKEILKHITAVFEPGMNAILGPTGSGKTSLLDILAGRKEKIGLTGDVFVDGNNLPSNFRCRSGYVVQDDVVMGTLTVRENLAFSAALRLPTTISNQEKRERVDEIINELGLTECKDTKVGTVFLRGVSGGEHKRTNIGMELIIKPSVLFLDEPTTGLDANTAFAVMNQLALLSKRGRTIIFSIHQPRFSIFRLFDTLHLLSRGETVFHGQANDSLQYFNSIGYECEEHNNPPDFFLDVIIQDSNGDRNSVELQEIQTESPLQIEEGDGEVMKTVASGGTKTLAKTYKESTFYDALEEKAREIIKLHSNKEANGTVATTTGYATGFFTQVAIVSKRANLNYRRNLQVSIIQPFMAAFFSIVLGLVYFDVDESLPSGTQNRTGAFFFASMFMMFSNMSAMELFIEERKIFLHESSSGFYRTSAYFIAKVLCDMVPMRVVPTVIFSCIFYWLIGFRPEAVNFFIFTLTLCQITFCGCALIFLMSIRFPIISIATTFTMVVNILMFVFAGVVVNVRSIVDWLEWIKYLSCIRYSVNALSVNEFRGLELCRIINGTKTNCITGEMYLDDLEIDYSDWGLWQNHVALFCIMVGLFILAYIQLLRVPKYK